MREDLSAKRGVVMSERVVEQLDELAEYYMTDAGAVLNMLITQAYGKAIGGKAYREKRKG